MKSFQNLLSRTRWRSYFNPCFDIIILHLYHSHSKIVFLHIWVTLLDTDWGLFSFLRPSWDISLCQKILGMCCFSWKRILAQQLFKCINITIALSRILWWPHNYTRRFYTRCSLEREKRLTYNHHASDWNLWWSCDAIRRKGYWPTLVHVMAWDLQAPLLPEPMLTNH